MLLAQFILKNTFNLSESNLVSKSIVLNWECFRTSKKIKFPSGVGLFSSKGSECFPPPLHRWHRRPTSAALLVQITLTSSCVYTGREYEGRKCRRGEQSAYCVHPHAKFYICSWLAWRNDRRTTQNITISQTFGINQVNQAWWLFMEILTQWFWIQRGL